VNDKDRDLIEHILRAAGSAGERGFAYLVRFEWVSGLADALGCLACAAFTAFLLRRLLKWKPKGDEDNPAPHIARTAGLIICSIVFAITVSSLFESLAQVIAPEGAAIHAAIHATLKS
jgi:hypothetical protein